MTEPTRSVLGDVSAHAHAWIPVDIPLHEVALIEQMKRCQASLEGRDFNLMVASIELGLFEAIQNLYGQVVSKRYLMAVGGRLRNVLNTDDHMADLGEGRFVVLSKAGQADKDEAIDAMRSRLQAASTGRFGLDGLVIDCDGPSVGVIVAASNAIRPEVLLFQVYRAMRDSIKTA